MRDYKRYEIQKRRFSANVVVGIYDQINANTGKTKEMLDIVCIPALNKTDGDVHAEWVLNAFNTLDLSYVFTFLRSTGFLCEVVTDGWANWKFKEDGRPDISTARPLYEKPGVLKMPLWRGCYWYFQKGTGRLMQDDVGMHEDVKDCVRALLRESIKLVDDIDHDGFKNEKLEYEKIE